MTALPLRVLVVADDQLARAWLASLLAGQADLDVVGQAGGGEDWPPLPGAAAGAPSPGGDLSVPATFAVEFGRGLVEAYRPDVIVCDLGWDPARARAGAAVRPGGQRNTVPAPLERLAELRDLQVPVVALVPGEEFAADAWSAGARGVLLREVAAEPLRAALHAVARGLAVLEPRLSSALAPARPAEPGTLPEPLTPREREVLQLLAEGLSNKAIAARLDVSEHTVKFHVNALMGKLGAQSRTEAVVRATRLGLIVL